MVKSSTRDTLFASDVYLYTLDQKDLLGESQLFSPMEDVGRAFIYELVRHEVFCCSSGCWRGALEAGGNFGKDEVYPHLRRKCCLYLIVVQSKVL